MVEQTHLFRSCFIYISKILEIGTSIEDVYLSKYTKVFIIFALSTHLQIN